jgi:hypothetical protein
MRLIKKLPLIGKLMKTITSTYDEHSKELTISLNISKLFNKINIKVDTETDFILQHGGSITSYKQLDVITHDSLLCLDTVNSYLHFNSQLCRYFFNGQTPPEELIIEMKRIVGQLEQNVGEDNYADASRITNSSGS